jgi:hypothetical protein
MIKAWEDGEHIHKHFFRALRDALAEDRLDEMQALTEIEYLPPKRDAEPVALYVRADDYEYDKWGYIEMIGTIDGTYGGRWMLSAFAKNASAVWPDGTAIYVRRRVKE